MTRRLVVVSGPDAGARFDVTEGQTLVLGRGVDSDAQLSDPAVSRVHCRVECTGNQVLLIDADSKRGTLIGGRRIDRHELQPGDVFDIGETRICFETDDAPAASVILDAPTEPDTAAAVALSVLMGQQLGKYLLEQVLAPGQTGIVFLAIDQETNRQTAVKVLPPQFVENEEQAQRFVRSVQTMLPMRHENIVELYDAGLQGEYCWVAMEYVAGENLAHAIERVNVTGEGNWQEALRAVVHVARALREAWLNDIIHRNLTPTNVLRHTADNVYKLGDLMFSKALLGELAITVSLSGQMLGDMRYMSPERTRSNVDVDSRSDIYELGAVIYALLTGRPPFEEKSVVETVRLVRHTAPKPPKTTDPSIPDDFQDVVLRMLAKSPEERYANPDELIKVLEAVSAANGVAV